MGIAPKATERWFILGTAPPGSQGLYCRFVIAISPARLRARLEALARFGALPGGGVTRPCWSPPHEAARAWLLGELRAASLQAWVDPAGNVFGATGPPGLGADRPVVLTGSHIDTVPEGGILDGALGVLAGLECLEALREAGAAPRLPLAVAAWSDEEGRYGSLFGSRAFTGRLDEERIPDLAAVDGVEGTHFAVWAPNAKRVSVIGDFNGWNPDANVMECRPEVGVWECFVPGLGQGVLYKYRVVSHHNGYEADKADPYGFAAEIRPQTASKVAILYFSSLGLKALLFCTDKNF